MSFDITSILDFDPPSYVCPACRGLLKDFKQAKRVNRTDPFRYWCPVCGVEYVDDDNWAGTSIWSQFRVEGWTLDHRELFAYATALAQVVRNSRSRVLPLSGIRKPWPMTRTFLELVSRARYFVHFASWGISHIPIGALKMASMRVPVYGFVSDVDANTRAELTDFPDETPQLTAKVIPSSQLLFDAPHQKLVVVDGLVAFKGSMNLTNTGLRRADRLLDISELVTDFAEVTELNNKYFAPVWRRLTAPEDTFACALGPPF